MYPVQAKLIAISIALLLQALPGFSQLIISGTVKDNKGNPVNAATLALKDSYDGGVSDSSGRYSFSTTEKGVQLLVVSAIGFKPYEQQVNLASGSLAIHITLKPEITELTAVILSAGTFEASDRKKAAAVLDPIDIVTTASANGDITGALKSLPGTQQVGESEGLFVRGGTAAETKIFIDGTLVNKFFQTSVPNIAQFGRFNPFLFKGTVFSTGGYSALYGQALSSALVLESIDLPEQKTTNLGISVLSLSAGYQHLADDKKSSWGINYSYSDLSLAFKVIKQRQEYSKYPAYHNGEANFRIKTSPTGIIKYYGYFNQSNLDFTVSSIDTLGYLDRFAVKNSNQYHNLSYKERIGKGWQMNAGISFTYNKDDIAANVQDMDKETVTLGGLETKNFDVLSTSRFFNAKIVLEKKISGINVIRFGSEYNYSNEENDYTAYTGDTFPFEIRQNNSALFAETDIYVTNDLAAKIGGRLEHASVINKTNIAPRLSLAYKLSKGSQVSLAYGIFYQTPESRYLPSPNSLAFMKATHYIVQFQRMVNRQSLRLEVFYKKYDNLIKTGFVDYREAAINNNGNGDAKGFELFWRDKKTVRNVDYWVSYSYLDTKRDYLTFPFATTPNFAAKHTGAFVVKKFVQKIKMNVNGSYNYASGRPYYNIMHNGSEYEFADRGTIPDYHNVSLSFNYLPFIGKKNPKSYPVWVLQVSNIFNTKQVFGYQYSYNGLRKEAIMPTSRMFVFLGLFISFGMDRSEDIINNNL